MTDQLDRIDRTVTELHHHIVGKPGQDGIVTRLAKVEQRQSLFTRIFAAIGTAIVGFGVWLVQSKS
jgi:hypothetical protein